MNKVLYHIDFPGLNRFSIVAGLIAVTVALFSPAAFAAEGMVNLKSPHSVSDTIDRLSKVLESNGMKIFARIDHAKAAASVGNTLRPTELLIFGNPKVGSPLMVCAQSVAIDLPQKALAWQDEAGQVWLSWNDPEYLDQRHGIGECGGVLAKVKGALGKFAAAATSEEKNKTISEEKDKNGY